MSGRGEKWVVAELGFERGTEVEGAKLFPGKEKGEEAVLGHGAQGDRESAKSLTDGEEVVLKSDFAFAFDATDEVSWEVLDGGKSGGHGAGTGLITAGRGCHLQGLMRTQLVVDVAPLIELGLAMREAAPRGRAVKQFDFEGAMEAFAFALGLGVIRPAMSEIDSQAQEPDAERSEAAARIGARPGGGIIAQDPIGEAVALEGALQSGLNLGAIDCGTSAQDQGEAGVIVENGEGKAAPAACEREVTFKIHLPELIGSLVREALKGSLRCGVREHAASVTFEDGSDGADGREITRRDLLTQEVAELTRTPAGETMVEIEHEQFGLPAGLSRRVERSAGAIGESLQAVALEAIEPLVGRRRTDGKATRELTNVGMRLTGELNEFETLHWDSVLAP